MNDMPLTKNCMTIKYLDRNQTGSYEKKLCTCKTIHRQIITDSELHNYYSHR